MRSNIMVTYKQFKAMVDNSKLDKEDAEYILGLWQ